MKGCFKQGNKCKAQKILEHKMQMTGSDHADLNDIIKNLDVPIQWQCGAFQIQSDK